MIKNTYLSTSPYFYWYQFLKRSSLYKDCCDNNGQGKLSWLYDDFGNIFKLNWNEWWEGYQSIFEDDEHPSPWYLHRIESEEDLAMFSDDSNVSIIVNLFESKGKLIKAFSQLLDQVITEKNRPIEIQSKPKGRPKFTVQELFEGYQFCAVPNIQALDRALKVYDLWHPICHLPKSERTSLYEIGKQLKLSESFELNGQDDPMRIEKKNKMTATASRYYRQAVIIIENIEKGIFPRNYRSETPSEKQPDVFVKQKRF